MHAHKHNYPMYTQLIDVLSTYVDVGGKMKELDSSSNENNFNGKQYRKHSAWLIWKRKEIIYEMRSSIFNTISVSL